MTLTCCQDHILHKLYGLYVLKHLIVEMRGGVMDMGRRKTTNIEDRATQPIEAGGWVSQLFLDHVYLEVLLDVSFLFGNTWLTLGSISKVDKFSDRASSQYKASNIRFTSNSDELPDEFKVEPSRLIWPLSSSAECRKSVSNRSPLKICLRSVSTKIERQRSVLRSQPCHFDIFSGASSHGNGVLGIVEDLQAEQFCKLNNWRERWGGCMPEENIVTLAS